MTAIPTQTGLRAWFGRKAELLNVTLTLKAAESDRAFLVSQLETLPPRLHQLDRDLEVLRVQQALLRNR